MLPFDWSRRHKTCHVQWLYNTIYNGHLQSVLQLLKLTSNDEKRRSQCTPFLAIKRFSQHILDKQSVTKKVFDKLQLLLQLFIIEWYFRIVIMCITWYLCTHEIFQTKVLHSQARAKHVIWQISFEHKYHVIHQMTVLKSLILSLDWVDLLSRPIKEQY